MKIFFAIAVVLAVSACVSQTTGSNSPTQTSNASSTAALPDWIDPTPNSASVGLLPWQNNRVVHIKPGGEAIIVGLRNSECGAAAPNFATIMRARVADTLKMPDHAIGKVQLYDAGVGYYPSPRCGGDVPARGVGARLAEDYMGAQILLKFFADGPWVYVARQN